MNETEMSKISPRPSSGRNADRLSRPAFWVLIGLSLETIYSVVYRSVFLAIGSMRVAAIAGILLLLGTLGVYALRVRIARICMKASAWRPAKNWFAAWLITGVVLRLLWHLLFHTIPRADGLIYFNMAASLAREHHYAGAFFPPGLPFFEAPFLMLLGAHFWVAALCTLICFTGVFSVVRVLARDLGGERVSALACALVAIWPNDVAAVGVNPKEELLAFLVTTSLWLYLKSVRTSDAGALRNALAGALLGFSALTQPAFLLFPAVVIGCELLWRGFHVAGLVRVSTLCVAMLLVIAPWTVRNHAVFHRSVLITTNGGSVFYRANNPNANAQYEPVGAEKLGGDEFAASDAGYRAARLWIRQHPLAFAKLMVRKQVVYLGDDSDRVYESVKRQQEPNALLYAGLKLLCNGFWLAISLFLVAASSWIFRIHGWRLWYGLCVLPLVYQWCIDSVFEAGSRHHVPYFGLISVLVAIAVFSATDASQKNQEVMAADALAATTGI